MPRKTAKTPAKRQPLRAAVLEYYQFPFAKIQDELFANGITQEPHIIRSLYWQFVQDGEYTPSAGRGYVERYLQNVESELAARLGQHSLAYWLHAYRRLHPGPTDPDETPTTVVIVRGMLEAAFQKYASPQTCSGI